MPREQEGTSEPNQVTFNRPLVLSASRVEQEVRRALAADGYDRLYRRRRRRLVLFCVLQFVAGIWLLSFADHVSGQDIGLALFYSGILVGYMGPYWTLLLWWRKGDL